MLDSFAALHFCLLRVPFTPPSVVRADVGWVVTCAYDKHVR